MNSQYLTLVLQLADAAAWPDALLPLFEQEFFTPVSLLGCAHRTRSVDYFFSGHCVDELPFAPADWPTNEIYIAQNSDDRQTECWKSLANALKGNRRRNLESESETFDRERYISFLAAPPLPRHALKECRSWGAGRKHIRLKMIGTVDFACDREGFTDLANGFQFAWRVFGRIDCRLGAVRGGRGGLARRTARSSPPYTIWLANPEPVRSPITLGGRMTPAIADEYVDRNASLCRHLVEAHKTQIQSVSVGLGDAFHREHQRLEDAIRARLDNCPTPLDFW